MRTSRTCFWISCAGAMFVCGDCGSESLYVCQIHVMLGTSLRLRIDSPACFIAKQMLVTQETEERRSVVGGWLTVTWRRGRREMSFEMPMLMREAPIVTEMCERSLLLLFPMSVAGRMDQM